jgi:hypothetical protein
VLCPSAYRTLKIWGKRPDCFLGYRGFLVLHLNSYTARRAKEKIAKEKMAYAYSKTYTDPIIEHPMEIFKGKVIST